MSKLLILLVPLALSACAQESRSSSSVKISADVFASTLSKDDLKIVMRNNVNDEENCLLHIQSVACLSESKNSGFDTNCKSDFDKTEFLIRVPDLIEQLPPVHRKVFCHLSRLQIQPNIVSIGYATLLYDANHKASGTMIGVRADAIEGKHLAADLFSWKEQLNFGLSKLDDPTYSVSSNGPKVIEGFSGNDLSIVLHVMVHEISHLIDFLNQANHTQYLPVDQTTIKSVEFSDSFALISWPAELTIDQKGRSPEWVAAQPLISKLCYYSCESLIPVDQVDLVYSTLQNSTFMTAYSASNNMEDFAESSTMHYLKPKGFVYKITDGSGTIVFDLERSWASKKLASKNAWLKEFYARDDLKYQY